MDTEKICRTCLGLTGPFLSIFDDGTGSSTGSIADMLRNFTKTKPRPADNMPEKVCLICISEINRCYSFKLKCEQSNRTLRQMLPNALPEEPDISSQVTVSKPPVSTANKSAQTISISDVNKKETVSREVQTLEEDQRQNVVEEVVPFPVNILSRASKRRKTKSTVKVVRHDDDGNMEERSEVYEITGNIGNDESAIMGKAKNNGITILHMTQGEGEYTEMILNDSTGEWRTDVDISDDECNAEKRVNQAKETETTDEYKLTIYNNENGEEEFAPSSSVTTRKSSARKRASNQDLKESSSSTSKNKRAKRSGVEKAKEIVQEMENECKKPRRLLNSNANTEDLLPEDNISTDKKPFELKHLCEYCNAGFVIRKSLLIHQRHNNCRRQTFKCEECESVFISEEHLVEHRSTHTAQACAECSETFATKEELSKHMIDGHKRSSKNKCNVCQKVFTMLSALRDHERIHTGEKPFVCQICNKGFTQSANMRQHMFRHSKTKRFQCDQDQCDSSFVTKAELLAHTRTHTGDKPYQCYTCEAKFTTSSSLVKHKRKHTGEIPYACELCPMRFTALNVLKNHRRTHTGEKPYSCPHCPRRFTQNGDCILHQRTHQNANTSNPCNVCYKDFKTMLEMKRHLKVHTDDSDKSLHMTIEINKKDSNDDDEDESSEKTGNNVEEQEFIKTTMEGIY